MLLRVERRQLGLAPSCPNMGKRVIEAGFLEEAVHETAEQWPANSCRGFGVAFQAGVVLQAILERELEICGERLVRNPDGVATVTIKAWRESHEAVRGVILLGEVDPGACLAGNFNLEVGDGRKTPTGSALALVFDAAGKFFEQPVAKPQACVMDCAHAC
jgi:hypothetical protein